MVSSASPDAHGGAPIVLLGAGGHGRVALDVCLAAGLNVAGFLDRQISGTPDGRPILGDDSRLGDHAFVATHRFLPTLGDQVARRRVSEAVLAAGGTLVTAVHPAAVISPRAQIGAGTLVVAGAVINTGTRIGRYCIINTRASIDHDCVLEDGAQVGPGAILCGAVRLGADVVVGAGAVLLPGIKAGPGAIVGAGAVVTRDLDGGATVKGNPAR